MIKLITIFFYYVVEFIVVNFVFLIDLKDLFLYV